MDAWRYFLTDHWLGLVMLLAGGPWLAYRLLSIRHRRPWPIGPVLVPSMLVMVGLGGLLVPPDYSSALMVAGVSGLVVLLAILLLTHRWWLWAAVIAWLLVLLGVGGRWTEPVGFALSTAAETVRNIEVMQPAWLILLLLVPLVIYLSSRSLSGLGTARRRLAIVLRSALIVLLVLALAEARLRHPDQSTTVLFLVDRSLSIPEDWESTGVAGRRVDRRWERIKRFINESVEKRGPASKWDRTGVIVFGRRPRLELPPSDVPRLNFREVTCPIDPNYTDIGAAIKLALASFPENSSKRIVLLSDGNENLGNAEAQARIAVKNDVPIDIVPLAAGFRNQDEVLVEGVEAPPLTEQSAQLPIRVLLRSYNPGTVVGMLTLRRLSGGAIVPVPPSPLQVQVHPGLNAVSFKQTLGHEQQSYTYEATFQPLQIMDPDSSARPVTGYRTENKRATTHVIALGQRRLLLIEPREGEHQLLLDRLRAIGGESKFKVHSIEASRLPQSHEELGVFLSNYDCIILANVPAEMLNDEQQEMIRSNTHDQGCGLIMVGGPESFGAGGWQGTAVEKALPVDCEIKSIKVMGKGGLVMIMHASEMADGNRWQKEIAKLAVKKLGPVDEVGVLFFDWGGMKWHVPLQPVGGRAQTIMRQIDSLMPGDMPEFDSGLTMAHKELTDPKREISTKHIIIMSDGDPVLSSTSILNTLRTSKVTVTTVGVATHGPPQDQSLSNIAKATGGRYYNVKSPAALPSIYTKEARIVSQSFLYEKRFQPRLLWRGGPTEKLPEALGPLYGFVRTTAKSSPLVQMPILGPPTGDQEFPILAYWNYGLGKSVAFTSDARSTLRRPGWDRDWAQSDMYLKFWEQVINWALRSVETGRLTMTTEYRDGRVHVTIDARDAREEPITDLTIEGGITAPAGSPTGKAGESPGAIKFEEKNSGVYEASFKANDAGSYFINARALRTVKTNEKGKEVTTQESDSVRAGVTVPYSPEFADMESNAPLMEKLAQITGGQLIPDSDKDLDAAAGRATVYRRQGLLGSRNLQPIWYWLVVLAGIGLLFDVGVRRIALDTHEIAGRFERIWKKLRGRALAPAAPAFLERLKSRKAEVAQDLDRTHAARRFEAPVAVEDMPAPADATALESAPARPASPPKTETPAKEAEADFASRLMKAKKRVWEDRDRESS
jgi:uncharacterized membrane protein